MASTRLSPDSWINAGFDALVARGPAALKAEALARDLKTTKGSFYWHFKDVPDFHRAMLTRWERETLARLDAVLDIDGSPVQRLRHLSQVVEKEDKNYLFELKDKRKFDYETLKYLNQEPYIKKISV